MAYSSKLFVFTEELCLKFLTRAPAQLLFI
jgi:hypothetical protein